MKKFIFSALAAIGLLLSPSCSDENEALSGSGNEALVSFSVNLADGVSTKAISDGTKATKLVVDVFEKNTTTNEYTRIGSLRHKTDNNVSAFNDELKATVNFNLVKGKTYRLIFWAQKQLVDGTVTTPYDISDLSKIKVDYSTGITTDDEDRDAFLYVTDPITVSGNFTKSITMTRPFAQLNYLIDADEYNAAVLAGMVIQKAKVTVAKVATELYPLTNSVGVPAENVTFEVTPIPTNFTSLSGEDYISLPQPGAQTSTNKDYYYLASKYFLVYAGDGAADKAGDPATLATTSLKLQDASGDIANYEFKVPAVPVQRNYRTNIYGNLITSQGNFTVNIVPGFSGSDNNLPQSAAVVNNSDEIADKIAEGATTIVASESFRLSTTEDSPTKIEVPRNYEADNGVELTFDFSNVATNSTAIKITYNDAHNQKGPKNVNVIASGNITIDLENSHVTLNGNTVDNTGTYTEVTASTSGTTLVVPDGVTVERLIVKKGNVRIEKGGTVGTITRAVDNNDDKTIVFLEDGGELNINAITDPKIIVVQPAIISNAAELKAFAEAVNKGYTYAGETVVLTADINLNDANWTPIGLNADDSKKFKGTFDGQGHTIKNFKVTIGDVYQAAGFFGALNGTAKNFTIENATIVSQSTGNNASQTDNGVAVVAGSIYTSGLIQNVTVRNSSAEGHHYVAGIAGYVYGNVENCTVENSTFTSTPNVKSDTYDNGDKAGGIVGYTRGSVTGCSVSNLTIKAYRDLGGIIGCADGTVTNNKVNGLTLIIDATHNYKGNEYKANANPVVGRQESKFSDGGGNTATNVVYQVASETALTQAITYAQGATVQLTAGTYIIPDAAQGKTLTFIGTGNPAEVKVAVTKVGTDGENCDFGLDGSTVTFDGITITTNSSTYIGYARCKGTYKNCVINGQYTLYGDSKFENCTFKVSDNVYNIWTWGAKNMEFDGCTFNSDGKALLLYQEGTNTVNLTVKNCIFNDNGGLTSKKAAIEIGDAPYGKTPTYNVIVSRTTVNGYEINDEGYNTGTTLWGNKNSMPADRLNVTVDGVNVY